MIQASQVQFLLSAPQATAGYTMAGTPGNSLGLYAATTQIQASPLMDNFFTDWTGSQNAADQVDYQCLFVYNGNTVDTMLSPVAWMPTSLLGSGNQALFNIAADTTPPSLLASSTAQALAIQSPVQAPSGLTWYAPSTTSAGGVPMSNIPPGYCAALWVQRTANGVAATNQFAVSVAFNSVA